MDVGESPQMLAQPYRPTSHAAAPRWRSATVLIAFLRSGAVPLKVGDAAIPATAGDAWMLVLIAGFLAGFSERMVPDLLAKGPPGAAPMGALSATRVAEQAAALLARPEPVPLGEVAA